MDPAHRDFGFKMSFAEAGGVLNQQNLSSSGADIATVCSSGANTGIRPRWDVRQPPEELYQNSWKPRVAIFGPRLTVKTGMLCPYPSMPRSSIRSKSLAQLAPEAAALRAKCPQLPSSPMAAPCRFSKGGARLGYQHRVTRKSRLIRQDIRIPWVPLCSRASHRHRQIPTPSHGPDPEEKFSQPQSL